MLSAHLIPQINIFDFQLCLQGGEFPSPLRDPPIELLSHALLFARQPRPLQSDDGVVRCDTQEEPFGSLRETCSPGPGNQYSGFDAYPQWERHNREGFVSETIPSELWHSCG